MKKFITFLALTLVFMVSVNAQVAPAKLFDNTSIEIKGGINTPLNDFFGGISEQVGVQVEKGITPWLGFALDGEAFIHQPYGKLNPHTIFDGVNVNALAKFNLFNLFGNYPGYRRHFELNVFTGIGWGHRTCGGHGSLMGAYVSPYPYGERNYMTYTAGTDFVWNLGKQKDWGIVLSPAVTWGTPYSGKLSKNCGTFEINVGLVYHFKNKDGNRYFTKVKLYDQGEVDALNSKINSLLEDINGLNNKNAALLDSLANIPAPQTVVETVIVTETLLPTIQFLFNSDEISQTSEASIYEVAGMIKENPDKIYRIVGYASNEGSEEYNLALSKRRAEAVAEALKGLGVNPEQLLIIGGGICEEYPEPSLNRVVITSQSF